VTPQHFVRGGWFVGTAALTAGVYVVLYALGVSFWPATLLAWLFGFTFRLTSLRLGWQEPEPWREAPTPMPEEVAAAAPAK
jgi:uncharacterized membrane protein YeiH